jgi:hypothetical protein
MVSEDESRRVSFNGCPLGNKKNKGREGREAVNPADLNFPEEASASGGAPAEVLAHLTR